MVARLTMRLSLSHDHRKCLTEQLFTCYMFIHVKSYGGGRSAEYNRQICPHPRGCGNTVDNSPRPATVVPFECFEYDLRTKLDPVGRAGRGLVDRSFGPGQSSFPDNSVIIICSVSFRLIYLLFLS